MRYLLVTAIAIVVTSTAAHADPPSLTEPVAAPVASGATESYALQTLAMDGASLALIAAGSKSGALVGIGIAMYFAGAPAVHIHHDQIGHAGRSLLLRVGLPVLGAIVGHAITANETEGDGDIAGPALGVVCGAAAASLIDAAALARQPIESASRWTPTIGTTRQGGFTAGIAARF
ncbi:MAG TPA: hypothetical protein VMJ10_21380 [Kofleriaceae bacterium]|nr:hypothetical protein [Kofleriaceae bacterium]